MEFTAIPESAAKIASERRCAILVHSDRNSHVQFDKHVKDTSVREGRQGLERDSVTRREGLIVDMVKREGERVTTGASFFFQREKGSAFCF